MAFNPFQWIRKRQRTFLAILAIFTMFLFVLQFGRGDALEAFMAYVGGRTQGDRTPVATLHGQRITVTDIDQLRRDRELASEVMNRALGMGMADFERQDKAILSKAEEPFARDINQIMFQRNMRMDPRMMGMVPEEQARGQIFNDMRTLQRLRTTLLAQNKIDVASATQKLNRMLELELWARMTRGQDTYFGGNFATEGLLDFQLWKYQANRLGITLTDADIRKTLNEEALTEVFSGDVVKDSGRVREMLVRRFTGATLEDVYRVLGEEMRVRLAHDALIGVQPGVRAFQGSGLAGNESPSFQTPEQFYTAFKENRTELRVALLALPVERFASQVKKTPDDSELRSLFDRYREIEPTPDREKGAFKEPRRVRVEWVSAKADSPYYQKKSAEVTQAFDLILPLAGVGALETFGGLPLAALQTMAVTRKDPASLRLAVEYEAYVKSVNSWLDDGRMLDGSRPSDVGHAGTPDAIAVAVAQAAGVGVMPATVLTVPVGVQTISLPRQQELAVQASGAILAGTAPTILQTISAAAPRLQIPVKPVEAVREVLLVRSAQRHASEMVFARMDEIRKDMQRLSTKEATEYVAKNLTPDQGIVTHGHMEEAADRYAIENLPSLAVLKRIHGRQNAFMQDRQPPPFAFRFFTETLPYRPEFLIAEDEPFLYWKTEDRKAYTPTFEEAKTKVLAFWRISEARALARKEAETLAETIKGRKEGVSGERALRDTALKGSFDVIDPPGTVARLVPVPSIRAGAQAEYEPFRFPESQIAFPRADSVENLLKNLKQPGDTTILSDRPVKNFYLAVLIQRDEPTRDRFFDTYERAPRSVFLRDMLWTRFERDRQEQFVIGLLRELRREAKAPLDENGNYDLDAEVRKKVDPRNSDTGE